jgi:hypothetical protein
MTLDDETETISGQWRSRIVGSGEVKPDDLVANPFNWRIHPKYQRAAVEESLTTLGWIQQPIVNRLTGHVIDGHLRVQAAIARNEPSIPVLFVELTEEEERQAIASLDPLSSLAVNDAELMRAALEGLDPGTPVLTEFFDTLRHEAEQSELKSANMNETGNFDPKGVSVKFVAFVQNAKDIEAAIAATGSEHRGDAFLAICQFYLKHHAERKHDSAQEGDASARATQAH